jgi:hypothetical protein
MRQIKCAIQAAGLVLVLSAALAQAQPKMPEISPELMETRLLQIHRKAVQARIDWWKGKLASATTDEEIIEARKNIRRDYSRYLNDVYREAFTEMATASLMPMLQGQGLDLTTRLDQLRQLNVAIVLTKMKYLPSLPALKVMIASDNQALQYLGWQGYGQLQPKLLAKGGEPLKSYLALLADTITPETNPLILRPIFSALAAEGMTLPKAQAPQASKKLLGRFEAIWPMLRKSIPPKSSGDATASSPGDPVVFDLAEPAVSAVMNIAANLPADASAEKTRCLQLVYSMAQTAAAEYDRAFQQAPPDGASMARMGDLLSLCEDALSAMTGQKKQYVAEALQADVARGAAVQEAVLIKWLDDLKPMGVKEAKPVQ